MTFRVRINFIKRTALNKKLSDISSVTLHFFKPMNGRTRRSCTKMKKIGKFLLIKRLQLAPKPINNRVFGSENSFVLSIIPPIFNVNVRDSIQEHFHLIGLKYTYKILRHYFIKSIFYCIN